MTDRGGRHARGKSSNWGGQLPRSQEVTEAVRAQTADPTAKSAAKKNPDLCKVQHWKAPHTPVYEKRVYGMTSKSACTWDVRWVNPEPYWFCNHIRVCADCGKVLQPFVTGRDCPDYREITQDDRTRIALKNDELNRRSAAMTARRRLKSSRIDGPQGYRKPKAAG